MGSILTRTCESSARLDGKTAVITGANTGIGKITARDFYERGAKVILACRNEDKAKAAIENIKQQCSGKQNLGNLSFVQLDLSSLQSVRACAEKLNRTESQINLLINNAGIMCTPYSKTVDGYELQFGTNHLGHFLFTLLLMPTLLKSAPVRIVNVSSVLHEFTLSLNADDLNFETRGYGPIKAYIQSKLCNVLFTKELARKLKENHIEGINVYCLHPGCIRTDLQRHYGFLGRWFMYSLSHIFFKTPEQGAQTQIYCAVHRKCANETGLYYSECSPTTPSKLARNEELSKNLWNISLKMVGLDENYNPFSAVVL